MKKVTKICIISPSLEPYGGVRVIINWARYLSRLSGYTVTLASVNGNPSKPWIELPQTVEYIWGYPQTLGEYDIVIGTGPDTMEHIAKHKQYCKRIIYLCQMAEEMFLAGEAWKEKALAAALGPWEMITVAEWISEHYRIKGRTAPTYVVPNGVDEPFTFDLTQRDLDPTVLIEGWESNNEAKDILGLSAKVALTLKEQGIKILAYGQQKLTRSTDIIDEYCQLASTTDLVKLYRRSWFFLKASRYETRSLAPLEAMACGCVPVVGITQGHPDIYHGYNGLRAAYDYDDLLNKTLRLIESDCKSQMQVNGVRYVQERCDWLDIINKMVKPILDGC